MIISKNPEKKYKIVEYEIFYSPSKERFLIGGAWFLPTYKAVSMRGFMGYKFHETGENIYPIPNILWKKCEDGGVAVHDLFFRQPTIEVSIPSIDIESYLPATPKSVVFMEEE